MTRRVWAPVGKRPVAPGHHRFDWLYVTAFVSPASGETFWYVHDGVSKPFLSALLESFARAREAGAGVEQLPTPIFRGVFCGFRPGCRGLSERDLRP